MFRILYVDDEPDLLEIGKLFLERSGEFNVDIITSAPEALSRLTSNMFDAIISDYQMPGMNGIDFLKKVRASGNSIPFILFSGRGREEVVIQALNEGADFYLQKGGEPVSQFAELAHKVTVAIDQRRANYALKESEATLAKSRDYLDKIFSSVNAGILLIDAHDHQIVDVNPAAAEMIGVPREEITGRICHTYICQAERGHCPITDLGKQVDNSEKILLSASGRRIPIIKYVTRVRVNDRDCLLETFIDNTERKLADDALRESEQRYRTVFETTGTATILIENDATINLVNSEFERLSGYSREEIENRKKWTEFVVKEDLDWMLAQHRLRRTDRKSALTHYEFRYKPRSGEVRDIYLTIDGIPGTTKSVASLLDITDRKRVQEELIKKNEELNASYEQIAATSEELRANLDELTRQEQDLRKSEENYRSVIDNIQDMFYRSDLAGNLIMASPSVAKNLGYASLDSILNKSIATTFYYVPEKRDEMLRILADKGSIWDYEVQLKQKDGTPLWVSTYSHYYRDEKGNVAGIEGIFRDISERKKWSEALQESEEKYRRIIETANEGVWVLDRELNTTFVNQRFADLLGYSREEMIGHNVLDFVINEDKITMENQFFFRRKGINSRYECRLMHREGRIIWCLISGSPLFDDAGSFQGSFGMITDITEQKQVQAELHAAIEQITAAEEELRSQYNELARSEQQVRESEENFHSLVESSPDAIYISIGEKFVYVNPAMVRMMGATSADQLIGMSLYDRIQPSFHEGIHERAKIVVDRHEPVGLKETVYLKMDGTPIDIESAVATFWYRKKWAGLVILRDISFRKQTEKRLREDEEKYRMIVENTRDIIYTLNDSGEVKYISPSVKKILGYDPADITGRSVISFIHPDDQPFMLDILRRGITEGYKSSGSECRLRTASGEWRWFSTKGEILRDPSGNMLYLTGVATDITERKKTEEALLQSNKKLNMVSGITRHDINNQLTMLRGYLAILENQQPEPSIKDYFQKAKNAAQNISAMIQLAKEYEEIGIHAPVWQDCRKLVDDAAKQVIPGKITVKNDLPGNAEVFADPLIVKVVYNLMDNAIRHGGEISTIRFSLEDRNDEHIILCEDNGVGIHPDEKEIIFDRGFGKNTGLGLFLSREILAITDITLRETGIFGTGARFEIAVPKSSYRSVNPE